ncbi:MAG: dihydrodipicolinate synthase family protein, partial [Chloroflexota bacterium]
GRHASETVIAATGERDRPMTVEAIQEKFVSLTQPVLGPKAVKDVLPREVARLYDLVAADKWKEAQDLHYRLMPLNDAMFIEINPVPAKTALGMMGKISPEVRLPLAPLSPENEARLRVVLAKYGLVS